MDPAFETYRLNESGLQKAEFLAYRFDQLFAEIARICPAGRELSIVRTKLEEACFFAKKGMAGVRENQVVPPVFRSFSEEKAGKGEASHG